MRAFEFMVGENGRQERLTLKMINQWKRHKRESLAAATERAHLLSVMYGQGDWHEETLKAVEREEALVRLAKEKAELAAAQAKQKGDSWKKVETLAKSEMRRRKKV